MVPARYSNIWKVIYISLVFFLYQSIANSVVGIMSQITEQNSLRWAGPVATILLFFFSGSGALYNKYLNKYKYRYTFYFGSFGYVIYVASSLIFVSISSTSTGIVVGTCAVNIIGGLLGSVLYNSQWNYISKCSTTDNASMYFGINMGIIQASNTFGNLLSSYIVQPFGQKAYCGMMMAMIALVSLLFLLVREVDERLDVTVESTVLLPQEEEKQIKKTELYKMIPSFFFSGTVLAFVYTFISIIMDKTFGNNMSPLQLNSLTFKILMLEGVGEFLGGLFFIAFSDRWSKKLQLLITNQLFAITLVLTIISCFLQNIYCLGVGVVIVGFADCCSFSLDLAIVSEEGWGSNAFSLFNLGQCMGLVTSVLVMMVSPTEAYISYAMATQVLSSFFLHSFRPRSTRIPN